MKYLSVISSELEYGGSKHRTLILADDPAFLSVPGSEVATFRMSHDMPGEFIWNGMSWSTYSYRYLRSDRPKCVSLDCTAMRVVINLLNGVACQ